MRPYLAIIKDSFRAAMASRVLYVLLLLITILLLAIAPMHLRETLDWKLQMQANVSQPDQLLFRMVERRDDEKSIARIWGLLPKDLQTEMQKIVDRNAIEGLQVPSDKAVENSDDTETNNRRGRRRGRPNFVEQIHVQEDLVKELNKIIQDRNFYRAEDWDDRLLPSEAEDLVKQGVDSLSEIRVKRLNRLLIATAVSPTIATGNATALEFYYAIWRTPITLSITQQQFAQTLTSELPVYFDKFVMSIGLMIAIVVTANMVPETFEPGSLNLLLSKPISRWGLYVSKFFGGCVFIALCAGYLFLGVWLWMGLAMEVWDRAMLLSIPLYVIVFAIYFSVSAFVGLLWRSPIVAVILTLLFWAFCFTIGSVYGAVKTKMNNSEFISLLPIGDEVIASDVLHQVSSWNLADKKWDQKLAAKLGQEGEMAMAISSYLAPLREEQAFPGLSDFIAPVYDSTSQRVVAGRFEFGQFLNGQGKELLVADTKSMDFQPAGKFPRDTLRLFETRNGLIAVTASGLFYRMDYEKLKTADKDSAVVASDEPSTKATKTTAPAAVELFARTGPLKPVSIRAAYHVDYSQARDEFVFYQAGTIKTYKSTPEGYQLHVTLELKLSFDKSMSAQIAYAGSTILIAFGNGKIITVDAETLKELNEYQPESRSAIRQVAGSPNGRYFGVLYKNGNLWQLDTQQSQQMNKANVIGQGQIGAFAFGEHDDWWVSENTDRATRYQLTDGSRAMRHAPAGDWIEDGYRYALRPFYRVCPKPGEFYKVVTHLSSAGDTSSNENVDLNKTLQSTDPWLPLWSGLAFMLGMLTLGVLVFQFKDY